MERIWVWVRYKTIAKAIEALLKAGDEEHEFGRISSGAQAEEHRAQAEEFHAAKSDLWTAQHKPEGQPDMNQGSIVSAPHSSGANAAVHEGNIKLVPWLVLTAILSGFSLATGIFVMIQFAQMENNQARMAVHLMSNDALLLREGIIQPGDQWAGPEGNLEYGRKDQPRKK
jgi:hypothetical protein